MKKYIPILLLILAGCDEPKQNPTEELEQLQNYFHIPGIAVIVTKGDQTLYENYLGYADVENRVPVDWSAR